jgi:hypothetical protein
MTFTQAEMLDCLGFWSWETVKAKKRAEEKVI